MYFYCITSYKGCIWYCIHMGRSESAYAFVGYSVSVTKLLESIHDSQSLSYVYDTLTDLDVFLADDNETENNIFLSIVGNLEMEEEDDDSWKSNKEMLQKELGELLHHRLLIPVIELTSNTRWGYNRNGVHGGYDTVSDDFTTKLNELRVHCPPDHTVVWIVRQSGS